MEVSLENRKSDACDIYKSYKTCLDDFLNKLKPNKTSFESRGLYANVSKTQAMYLFYCS